MESLRAGGGARGRCCDGVGLTMGPESRTKGLARCVCCKPAVICLLQGHSRRREMFLTCRAPRRCPNRHEWGPPPRVSPCCHEVTANLDGRCCKLSAAVLQKVCGGATSRSWTVVGGAPARSGSRCYNSIIFVLQMLCDSATLVYKFCYEVSGEVRCSGQASREVRYFDEVSGEVCGEGRCSCEVSGEVSGEIRVRRIFVFLFLVESFFYFNEAKAGHFFCFNKAKVGF